MHSFRNDYSQGIHPSLVPVLERLSGETNMPYGEDIYCERASETVRRLCGCPEAVCCFISGGTTTNVIAISALLRNSFEGVITPATGHINVHETGAVEYSGHKVLAVPGGTDGKLTPAMIESVLAAHSSEHMVEPKMCYISDTTELGGVYTKAELSALSECCRKNGLYLYLDGARLASALTAPANDLSLADIASLTDAFYIGGTKNGLPFGEMLVFTSDRHTDHLRWMIKNRGFMLAKGFVPGALFAEALESGLYMEMGRHSNECAARIAKAVSEKGIPFYSEPVSNQLFLVVSPETAEILCEKYGCNIDEPAEIRKQGLAVSRIVTSFATSDGDVSDICSFIGNIDL